jgi:sugar phosphate isomerase/epimerase
MKNVISFMGANYVAREIGWRMRGGWMEGDAAANAWFSPFETFPERFDAMLRSVSALGFEAIDMWTAHLNPAWATERHLSAASELLRRHKLLVPSLAGTFGSTLEEVRAACRVAQAVGAPVLGGSTPLLAAQRPELVEVLREYRLKLGVENHPEKTPEELVQRCGVGDEDVMGVAADTGWFGTQGYDAARAIDALAPRLFHVHLKDIRARRAEKTGFPMVDNGHETCRLGTGIVPIGACVRVLRKHGYAGAIAIEHEPEEFDPREDCRAGLTYVRQLLTA